MASTTSTSSSKSRDTAKPVTIWFPRRMKGSRTVSPRRARALPIVKEPVLSSVPGSSWENKAPLTRSPDRRDPVRRTLAVPQGIVPGRVIADRRVRRRYALPDPREEMVQDDDGIRDLDRAAVVGIGGVLAGHVRIAVEEIPEDGDGIAQVHGPVAVRIAADEEADVRDDLNTPMDQPGVRAHVAAFATVRELVPHTHVADSAIEELERDLRALLRVRRHGAGDPGDQGILVGGDLVAGLDEVRDHTHGEGILLGMELHDAIAPITPGGPILENGPLERRSAHSRAIPLLCGSRREHGGVVADDELESLDFDRVRQVHGHLHRTAWYGTNGP